MYLKKIIILSSILLSLTTSLFAAPSDTAIQNEVLSRINAYRQNHGLSKLKMDNNLVREAKQHSQDMATHRIGFGHQGFATRIKHLHTNIKNSGAGAENVAYNYNPKAVVEGWIKSSGHYQNIVGNYDLTGIGVARDSKGRLYYTQLFLRTGAKQQMVMRRPFFGVSFRRGT